MKDRTGECGRHGLLSLVAFSAGQDSCRIVTWIALILISKDFTCVSC